VPRPESPRERQRTRPRSGPESASAASMAANGTARITTSPTAAASALEPTRALLPGGRVLGRGAASQHYVVTHLPEAVSQRRAETPRTDDPQVHGVGLNRPGLRSNTHRLSRYIASV
jgi:hypothetical protein